MKIKLGSKVRDKITGFTGVATAKIEYLNGCVQVCIRPPVGVDNKMPEHEYIDIEQIEVIDNGDTLLAKIEKKFTGGPQRDCPKH